MAKLEYQGIVEQYTMPVDGIIALIQRHANGYTVQYNPYDCPCHTCVFDTLAEARETVKRHRPLAILA